MQVRSDVVDGLAYALRSLTRRPTLALVGVLTIAMGSGAFAAAVSVRNGFLGRPIVAAAPDELRVIDERRSGATAQPVGIDAVPWDRFLAYRGALDDVFLGVAADRFTVFALSAPTGPVAVSGYLVSGNYFQVLGAPPVLGRYFAADDEASVVLGYDLWRREYAGDRDVVGQVARVDGAGYTIVGVAPRGFHGTLHGLDGRLFVPIRSHPTGLGAGFGAWVTFFGRLRPGVSDAQVAERVHNAAITIPPLQQHTTVRGADVAALSGVPPAVQPVLVRFLGLMLAMGGAVLLIAAANITGVMVALGVARRPEMVVRMALGASRRRLVAHVMAETLVLFAVGACLGLVVGAWATRVLASVRIPVAFDVALDLTPGPTEVLATVLVALAVGTVFGLVPASHASGWNIASGLKAVTRSQRRVPRGWRLFVGCQITLSVMLLVAAGLFARSLAGGLSTDPGFDPEGVVIGKVELAPHGYADGEVEVFFEELVERVRALPGVESSALAETVPLGTTYGRSTSHVRPEGGSGDVEPGFNSAFTRVGEGYFQSMRTVLVVGRGFDASAGPAETPVAVVNETFAERAWPGRNPLGQSFRMDGRSYQVIGVAEDGRYGFIGEDEAPYVFRSLHQEPRAGVTIHARTTGAEGEALARLRSIVSDLDPDVPLQGGLLLSDLVGLTLFPQRMAAGFISVFGLVGLLFAGVGIYGMIAFHARQRTHEIGIRMVLGAQPTELVRRMTLDALGMAAAWVMAGLVLAAVASGPLQALMIGITPRDPATYGLVAVIMLVVTGLAAFLPSRRASSIDPSVALREE